MHRRHQRLNIPTEVVRALVAIADTGSVSKTAEQLNLSQAAVSAQLKRLEAIVGEPVFARGPGGLKQTERGAIAIASARRMLDANDQIVRLGRADDDLQPVRIGLSMSHAASFLPMWSAAATDEPVILRCDRTTIIAEAFSRGLIDIACLLAPPIAQADPILAWDEEVVWVRSRDFVISPGAPFPLIDWHGSLSNEVATRALDAAGLSYRFVVTCTDFHIVMKAVQAKIGVIALPAALVAEPLKVATDYYFPRLRPLRAGIYVRDGFDSKSARYTIEKLMSLKRPSGMASELRQ